MKANRKFVEDEEAVSAVIGVILMVAITVAIAATVYVYVSGMVGGGSKINPSVSMLQSGGFITITGVQNGPVTNSSGMVNVINQTTGLPQAQATGYPKIINGAGNSLTLVEGGDTIALSFSPTQASGRIFMVQLISAGNVVGTCTYRVP